MQSQLREGQELQQSLLNENSIEETVEEYLEEEENTDLSSDEDFDEELGEEYDDLYDEDIEDIDETPEMKHANLLYHQAMKLINVTINRQYET